MVTSYTNVSMTYLQKRSYCHLGSWLIEQIVQGKDVIELRWEALYPQKGFKSNLKKQDARQICCI